MSFSYEEAKYIVERAKQKPKLPLRAFVPIQGPILTDGECDKLSVATGIPVADLKAVFQREIQYG